MQKILVEKHSLSGLVIYLAVSFLLAVSAYFYLMINVVNDAFVANILLLIPAGVVISILILIFFSVTFTKTLMRIIDLYEQEKEKSLND